MPGASKFTAARRATILEMLSTGASRRLAARIAGIDHATLTRWIQRGESAREGSRFAEFAVKVHQAEAEPQIRALTILFNAMPDRPDLAWKYIERRVDGFQRSRQRPSFDATEPTDINVNLGQTIQHPPDSE